MESCFRQALLFPTVFVSVRVSLVAALVVGLLVSYLVLQISAAPAPSISFPLLGPCPGGVPLPC